MRKFLLSSLLLVGVVTTANLAFAGDWRDFPNGREQMYRSSHTAVQKYSNALLTNTTYGDSTYIGYTPGAATAANPWAIRASTTTFGSAAKVHRPPAAGCMWNWDAEAAEVGGGFINGDTLQGWWPLRANWRYLYPGDRGDYDVPGSSIDYGNLTNYYPVHGRTFGVVGAWHCDQGGDPTGTGTALNGQASNFVTWVPLHGLHSAWCGLRQEGDATAPVDPITGNRFNADAAQYNIHGRFTAAISRPKFPGYVDQWDQMLYRDINMTGNASANLGLSFQYSTRMSTTADVLGWFDKDPLGVNSDGSGITPDLDLNCAQGNFISNWELNGAGPVDSFMVYIGQVPNGLPGGLDKSFQQFNGTGLCNGGVGRAAIYDPLRRWFDEVVEANDPGKVIELVSAAGNDSNHTVNVTIPNSQISSILAADGNKVRVVFRVKTNSFESDNTSGSYNSRGRGAAQVDNVTYSFNGTLSSPAGWGDFEDETQMNLRNPNGALVAGDSAWRSTGKPPHILTHRDVLNQNGSSYTDLCGAEHDNGRDCSMSNGIISFAFADGPNVGDIGDPVPFTSDHDLTSIIMSPTIQLCGPYNLGAGANENAIGLHAPGNSGDARWGSDIEVDYETFTGGATYNAPPTATSVTYRWLIMNWPFQVLGNTPAGANKKGWTPIIRGGGNYQTDPICFRSLPGITGQEGSSSALIANHFTQSLSQNPTEQFPDSIKIGWLEEGQCYTTGVNACNNVGINGVYIDNVSLVILDGTPNPFTAEIFDWFQTSFPWNVDITPAFAASFDTCGILVRTGRNIGPGTGDQAYDVPTDSALVNTSGADPVRVDLVFRVLPGPGNYRIVGNSASGLTPNPSAGTPTTGVGRPALVPGVGSSNFWETFIANVGPFGTGGTGGIVNPGHPGGVWDPNRWNSARCDTAKLNLFPQGVGALNTTVWQSTYHDQELGLAGDGTYVASTTVRAGIGIPRHKCFLANLDDPDPNDIDCEHTPPAAGTGYDLSWVTATGSGYNGVVTTIEGTKIFPDGLFTPGAHIEYFFRRAQGGSTALAGTIPDTNIVVPQAAERNNDGHRFAGFGALPDRWKQSGYTHPLGLTSGGPACMLVVNDQTTNSNDWQCWSGVADTIGATSSQKWGAEVGWHAKGGDISAPVLPLDPLGRNDINDPRNNVDRAGRPGFIAEHGGNPGTSWDGFQIIGAEGTNPSASIGAFYAHSDGTNTQVDGKRAQCTPSLEMMKTFYKVMIMFTGNLNALIMGPSGDRSSDDAGFIRDWLLSGNPASLNRAFWGSGDGFIDANKKEGVSSHQVDLDINYLGADLQNGQYREEASNIATTITLTPKSGSLLSDGRGYGVRNTCLHTNDVEKVAAGAVQPLTSVLMEYQDPNPGDLITYPASILKVSGSVGPVQKPWASLIDGFDIADIMSKFGSDTRGRSAYFYEVLTKVFNAACPFTGTPVVPLDVPNLSEGNLLSDFVNLRNNPYRSGMAAINFGLAKDDRVTIRVYDVTGRQVKSLADRMFKAGEHTVLWDGTDDGGHTVAKGVYFTQVKYREGAFSDAKKLTVLK